MFVLLIVQIRRVHMIPCLGVVEVCKTVSVQEGISVIANRLALAANLCHMRVVGDLDWLELAYFVCVFMFVNCKWRWDRRTQWRDTRTHTHSHTSMATMTPFSHSSPRKRRS